MYYLTCSAVVMLFSFMLLLLLGLTAPLSLAFLFFCFVMLSTFSIFLFSSDFFPYMLYLIYIGGLLVLVVYMVIISTNYQLPSMLDKRLIMIFVLSIFLTFVLYSGYVSFSPFLHKNMISVSSLEFNVSILIALVLFLLYAFMYICESVRLGGRALNVSTIKY